jgi:hypothetical protein
MNIRKLSSVLLFTAVCLFAVSAAPSGLVASMAVLDKTYIPALGLSGQADQQAKAKTAFGTFENAWEVFKARFEAEAGFDPEWTEDLEKVGAAVSKAKSALIEESNGPEAHEALEKVRMIFLASRTRQRIPYFLDYMTLFHNSMEELLNNKPAGKIGGWSVDEKAAFSADLDISIARWKKVKAKEGLLPEAALNAKAGAAYATQWQAIDSILAGIKKAFDSGDEKAFSEKLGQLKPNFIKTFFLFGDFPR